MKKLVVTKVESGFFPYGPHRGNHGLAVYFDEVDGEYNYEPPEQKDEEGKEKEVFTSEQIAAFGLMKDIEKKCLEAGCASTLGRVLMAQEYLFIVGEAVSSNEHRKVSGELFGGTQNAGAFEKTALYTQLDFLKINKNPNLLTEEEKAKFARNVRSPLTCLITEGKFFIGRELFYEHFRNVTLKMSLKPESPTNLMACVNICNIAFAAIVFDFDTDPTKAKEQMDFVEKTYIEPGAITVIPMQVYVIDNGHNSEVVDFTVKHHYRLDGGMAPYKEGVVLKV